jgi:hypothetical protein
MPVPTEQITKVRFDEKAKQIAVEQGWRTES